MKKIIVTLLISASLGLSACQDTFLQMPDTTGTVDLNEVYGSAKNAKSALMTCYREALIHGLPGGWGVGHGTLGAISGEISRGYSWHGTYTISQSGLDVNGTDGSDAGSDHFGNNWAYIRHCFTVRENIDRVPDMSDQEKNYVKAVGHYYICTRLKTFFPASGVQCPQCCGCRKKYLWKHDPDDRQQKQCHIHTSCRFLCKFRIMVRDKWSDPHHMRIQVFKKNKIFRQILQRLSRRTYHKSGTYLISQFLQGIKTLFTVCKT